MSISNILVPVDFSEESRDAARMAAGIASHHDASLTLFHVNDLPDMAMLAIEPIYVPSRAWNLLSERKAHQIEAEMAELAAELDIEVATDHRRGHIVDTILQYATEVSADLIVMGSQGEGAGAQFMFGSVAAKVSRAAPCPVIVSGPGSDEITHGGVFTRAVVGIDFSPFSPPTTRLASEIVEPNGSIACVHVWQEPSYFALDRFVQGGQNEFATGLEAARNAELNRLREFVSDLPLRQPEISSFLEIGAPAQELLARARRLDADLIAVGSHGRHGLRELLIGTVADRVLRHASVPVLFIPQSALAMIS